MKLRSKFIYGFQGQERDDEIKGAGNSYNYEYRMHDPRIGRFFACDPLESKYPWYTPYQFSGNKVISHVELEGLEEAPSGSGSTSPQEMIKRLQSQIDANNQQIVSLEQEQQKIQGQVQQLEGQLAIENKKMADLEQRIAQNGARIDAIHNTVLLMSLNTNRETYWGEFALKVPAYSSLGDYYSDYDTHNPGTVYSPNQPHIDPANMATGSCYPCGIADPFIQIGQEGLAGGLQNIGMSEGTANNASSAIFFFGSILVSRKLGSIGTKGVNPNTLIRTETGRSWTISTRNVANIMNSAKTEGIREPIDVFMHNGQTYIINGHHRVHAAMRLNQNVPVNYLSAPKGYSSIIELQQAAYNASLNPFKVDGRMLNGLLKGQ